MSFVNRTPNIGRSYCGGRVTPREGRHTGLEQDGEKEQERRNDHYADLELFQPHFFLRTHELNQYSITNSQGPWPRCGHPS